MVAVTVAAAIGMAITTGLAATAWFARIEAEAQRNRAEAETETARQTTQFMVDMFKVSDPSEALGNTITAREILDQGARRIEFELQDQPAIQSTLMDTIGTDISRMRDNAMSAEESGDWDPLMQIAILQAEDPGLASSGAAAAT